LPSEAQRNQDLSSLLVWGLAQYNPVEVIGAKVYGTAEIGYGRRPVQLVARQDIIRTVRVGTPIVERVVLRSALALPVARGQQAGEVRVFAGGRLIARAPLVAADSAPAVGAVGRTRWYARRTVHHLVGLVS
jgi:D-alanyl-D-alanine carboxypeptidase